jgi:hypothetical protein
MAGGYELAGGVVAIDRHVTERGTTVVTTLIVGSRPATRVLVGVGTVRRVSITKKLVIAGSVQVLLRVVSKLFLRAE